MVIEAKRVDFIVDAVITGLSLLAVVFACLALVFWTSYRTSRKFVLVSWLLVFVAPFLISVVPLRQFVYWDGFDEARLDYVKEFRAHFLLEEREKLVIDTCLQVIEYDGSQLDTIKGYVDRVCGIVDFLPSFLCSSCRRAKDACRRVQEAIKNGPNPQEILASMKSNCKEIILILGRKGSNAEDLMAAAQELLDAVKTGAEISVCLLNALLAFQIMMPAALSLAPVRFSFEQSES